MTAYSVEPTFQYFHDLIETKTPIVPMLSYVNVKRNGKVSKELSIIYYNPREHALSRIYDISFATFMFERLMSFELGMSSHVLAGIVRPSKPSVVEQWQGDTIEKVNYESYSLYRGILSIIGNNDGLPLVVPQNTEVIGDIVQGVKENMNGRNPIIVRQEIKQFEALQYRIAEIIGDNPYKTAPVIADNPESALQESFQGLNDKQFARLRKLNRL